MFPVASMVQVVTQTTLLDFQSHVADMFTYRGYILDWYANGVTVSRALHLPDVDLFSEFHDPDPNYSVPDSGAQSGAPHPFVVDGGDGAVALSPAITAAFRNLAKEVVLTAHEPGQATHSIAVFAQTGGQSFKKDAAEDYAAFLRHFRIKHALFGLAAVKALTTGAKAELNQPDFEVEMFNLGDSALRVVQNVQVPPGIKKVPPSCRSKCLELLQCRRPLALHRKHNPYTPLVLPGQGPKDKVSRYLNLKDGDIVCYERVGSSSGWDRPYRHIRDQQDGLSSTNATGAGGAEETQQASATSGAAARRVPSLNEGTTLSALLQSGGDT